jgi:hypothetical protein
MSEERQKNQERLAFGFARGSEAPSDEQEGTEALRGRRETEDPADSITTRTAVYGSVRTVVWEGRRSNPSPYPDLKGRSTDPAQGHSLRRTRLGFFKWHGAVPPAEKTCGCKRQRTPCVMRRGQSACGPATRGGRPENPRWTPPRARSRRAARIRRRSARCLTRPSVDQRTGAR